MIQRCNLIFHGSWPYQLTRSHDSFQFRDSYAYPRSFLLTFSVSARFFPVLSLLFASTGATNGKLRRASVVFCFETSYRVQFLPRIPSTNTEHTASASIRYRTSSSSLEFRSGSNCIAKKRSRRSPARPIFHAKSIGKSRRIVATFNSSSTYERNVRN